MPRQITPRSLLKQEHTSQSKRFLNGPFNIDFDLTENFKKCLCTQNALNWVHIKLIVNKYDVRKLFPEH